MRLFMASLLLVSSAVFAADKPEEAKADAASDLIVDVSKLAGASKKDVVALLGEPKECEKVKQGNKCLYDKGETEIVFIDKKADWITVNAMTDLDFGIGAIEKIGLKIDERQTFSNADVIRWENLGGMKEVSLFSNGKGKVTYAYIKVKTE